MVLLLWSSVLFCLFVASFPLSSACTYGSLRLVRSGSTTTNRGRLEICIDNVWGTVCDDYFTTARANAQVACRQLGQSTIRATYHSGPHYGRGSGYIWLANVGCTGSESTLLACSFNGIGFHNCDHDEDVGVSCGSSNTSVIVGSVVGSLMFFIIDSVLISVSCVIIIYCYQKRKKTTSYIPYTFTTALSTVVDVSDDDDDNTSDHPVIPATCGTTQGQSYFQTPSTFPPPYSSIVQED